MTQIELEQILSRINSDQDTDSDWELMVPYVFNDLRARNGFDPSNDDVTDEIQTMITGYALRQLVKKDLVEQIVDEDGNFQFELTEFGKDVKKELLCQTE